MVGGVRGRVFYLGEVAARPKLYLYHPLLACLYHPSNAAL